MSEDPILFDLSAEAVATVTLNRPGAPATAEELLAWLRPKLASFRMPRHLRIVPDFEAIGMTASGKVQKAKLREHAERLLVPPGGD